MTAPPFRNLIEVLAARAREQPAAVAYTFLLDGEEQSVSLSYGELDAAARALGARLQQAGAAGERVLLLFPPGLDFIAAFWGCLYAGAVAVPAYPPRPGQAEPDARLAAIVRDARPRAALTVGTVLAKVRRLSARLPDLARIAWLAADDPAAGTRAALAGEWREPAAEPGTLAFLQYTSGSTALPKGVMVSHGNILHNEEMIRRAFGQSRRSVIVGWLPLYHDMGLIGNVLQPLYLGARCVLMSPLAFLQRPVRWLQAVSRHRATTSGGPNFAYDLCARRVAPAEREALDLASWELAFCGAEPVRAETLDRFAAAFAPAGFRRRAFYPCYGLAEGTLFVAGGEPGAGAAAARFRRAGLEQNRALPAEAGESAVTLVACGGAWMGQRLAVADPATGLPCPEGRVGEIWVAGPSVAQGYWRRPEETAAAFGARLGAALGAAGANAPVEAEPAEPDAAAGADAAAGGGTAAGAPAGAPGAPGGSGAGGGVRYLRTGDLGFIVSGRLFIAGRQKDLIIVRGRNHHPQDIELAAERAHPALRPGCSAAFGVEVDGEERLALVLELDRRAQAAATAAELAPVIDAVRRAVADAHEVQVHDAVLVGAGTVPKTSSGKVQRHACRTAYLAGSLPALARREVTAAAAEPAAAAGLSRAALLALAPAERAVALAAWLGERAARAAGLAPGSFGPDTPLAGLDSLAALELKHAVESDLGVVLPLAPLLAGAPLRELVETVEVALAAAGGGGGAGTEVPAGAAGTEERGPSPALAPPGGTDGQGPGSSSAGAERRIPASAGASAPAAGAGSPTPAELDLPLLGPSDQELAEFPLSYGQRAIWYLDRLAPEAAAYNIAAAARVSRGLDAAALEAAWRALAARHAVLRTTFTAREGDPLQRVHERLDADFAVLPAVAVPPDAAPEERLALRAERLRGEAFRPFALESGPLLRLRVLPGDGEERLVLLAVHHLVTDFWSLGLLLRELGALYREAAGGAMSESMEPAEPMRQAAPAELVSPKGLAVPAVSYAGYVEWQRRLLAGSEGDRLWEHWRRRLAGELGDLDLPADRPRPPVATHHGDSAALRLGVEAAPLLGALGRERGATLYTILLAGFQALLHRASGQAVVAVGSPVAGRTRAALAGLPGYLVNAVVLPAGFADNPSFAEHLERTGGDVRAALEHQDFPFPLLAERLRPQRDPSRSPLFQVLFTLQRSPLPGAEGLAALALEQEGASWELGGLALQPVALPRRPAQFDLALEAAEIAGRIALVLRYNTDLFDAATAGRMLGHLAVLLAAAAERPAAAVGDLPLLSAAERRQLAAEAMASARPFPDGPCLHDLCAQAARQAPDSAALEMEGAWLSRGELERRADRLARRLRRLGAGPDRPVALYLERSPEMVVALLATLKAGGGYLPLDPSYPEERLRFMLRDAAAGVLVTGGRLAAPAWYDGAVLALDGGRERLLEVPAASPASPASEIVADALSLAYLIYTSGSTGTPKGVLVPHRGVVNFLASMLREPGLAAGDVLLSVTTLAFDIAALEIFLPLLAGARLALVGRETAGDGIALAAALARCQATAMQATPATWRLLLATGWRGCPGLAMLCGGEALPRELAAELLALPRRGALWNLYGPTETTIWSAAGEVAPGEGPVPLGPPIANTTLHLLDRRWQPVPSGVAGELWIGGAGVVRGYHRRPDLTAERFVPDPFAPEAGESGGRLYRTGDLARRRAGGVIEFLGRVDHQVKVRGHRIELGEIESCLAQHPAVGGAVVVAREDRPGDRRLVAYLVAAGPPPAPDLAAGLRAHLRARLPEPMVPGSFVVLDAWPLTPNGKIDRRALPAPPGPSGIAGAAGDQAAAGGEAEGPLQPRPGLERTVAAVWQEVLGVPRVSVRDNFFDLGGHSLLLARVQARLMEVVPGATPSMVDLLRHPTVGALAAFLGESGGAGDPGGLRRGAAEAAAGTAGKTAAARAAGKTAAVRAASGETAAGAAAAGTPAARGAIAVTAMAGRFPGAASVEALWQNLRAGVESIVPLSDEELRAAGVEPALLADPAYVKAAAALDGVEGFDAAFFGYTPREAEVLDPQHRIFLECAWEALELAGYCPGRLPGPVGVYAGVGLNAYLLRNLQGNREVLAAVGEYQAFISNDKDFVPTRVSYKLDLRGPSINVQTACSSSLVAVHLACQALLAGECTMALAGGVSVAVPHRAGYLHQEGGIASPDGHCRAFDARARGTVRGSGCGVVVLRRLADALAAGDPVLAVVRGSAINNDGAAKIGYTAPSIDGQAEVIAAALAAAGVDPETVGYVEAHGTGTELGDPVEVAALTQAFHRAGAARRGYCALGSLKTNLGHLDTAAGVAGLIKAALAVERGELPPSLHFERPNPRIDFAAGPFRVSAALAPWPAPAGAPRRAGVSSFGIGGTNAHVVLEQPPPAVIGASGASGGSSRPAQLLLLSARSAAALDAATAGLAAHLAARPELPPAGLADAAYTLQVGRRAFEHRRMAVCRGRDDAFAVLGGGDPERLLGSVHDAGASAAVFLLPGQGAQHPGMGAELYGTEPLYREAVDEGAELLLPLLGLDLRRLLDPPAGEMEEAARQLARTALAQPALFVVEHALARLWMAWGVEPVACLGHSVGELVAACLAGVFSFADALALVAERGRLMERLPEGAMLSVPMAERDLLPLLGDGLALSAVNAPAAATVAGPAGAVAELARRLAERGVETRPLHVSHAFHSAMMEPAVAPFAERVRGVERRAPRIPFLSNVSGTWITAAEATDPAYWGRHLRATVRFAAGVAEIRREPGRVLLEVGPGHGLTTLARQQAGGAEPLVAVPSMRHPRSPRPDLDQLLEAVGRLWMAGVPIDWDGFHGERRRRRCALPTYPFERRRHWVEPSAAVAPSAPSRPRAEGVEGWFYAPFWKESVPPGAAPEPLPAAAGAPEGGAVARGSWLILTDVYGLGARLAAVLAGRGVEVVTAPAPVGVAAEGAAGQAKGSGYDALLGGLPRPPAHIVHAAAVDPLASPEAGEALFQDLLLLGQALGRRGWSDPLALTVLSSGMHALGAVPADDVAADCEKALLLGPCRVLPLEYPHLACRSVDVSLPPPAAGAAALSGLAELVADEIVAGATPPTAPADLVVAYRGEERWVQGYEPVELPATAGGGPGPRLRERGVYLVTGGLGGLGLTFAELLAARARARLVLAGRSAFPERAEWERRLEGDGAGSAAQGYGQVIARLLALEKQGAELLVAQGDVTDPRSMAAVVELARRRFGAIHGVIHAAGVAGGGMAQLRSPAAASRVLAPKVRGTRVLAAALAGEEELDFVLLCASVTGVLGGFGQIDYCAANAFLDAYARRRARRRGTFWAAIDWDRWQGVGMAAAPAAMQPRPGEPVVPGAAPSAMAAPAGAGTPPVAGAPAAGPEALPGPAAPVAPSRSAALDSPGALEGPNSSAGAGAPAGPEALPGSAAPVAPAGPRALAAPAASSERLHPLLDRCLAMGPRRAVFATEIDVAGRWILGEHRILGRATVPGTAYLEMARAAFEVMAGAGPVEIREAVFLAPLAVDDGERVGVLTILERDGEVFSFRVASEGAGGAGGAGALREHARGRIGRLAGGAFGLADISDIADNAAATAAEAAPRRDLQAIRARCGGDLGEALAAQSRRLAGFLATGPRWQSLRAMTAGEGESLATLEMPAEHAGELAFHALHPALLDVAAGSVQLRGDGNYLPLAYESLRLYAPLPARLHSHARYRPHSVGAAGAAGRETLTCDLTLLDEAGAVVAEIAGFSMRRIGAEAAQQLGGGAAADAAASRQGSTAAASPPSPAGALATFAAVAALGGEAAGSISPREGAEVLCRVLGGRLHQVVVSTVDLETARRRVAGLDGDRIAAALGVLGAPATAPARREVKTLYIAPGNDLERQIAAVWQRVLGIEQIGSHDNFFELGGTSLSGVQLVAEIKKALGVEIPSVTIFEAPTVAALARHLAPKSAGPAFEHSQERARRKQEVLDRQRELAQGRLRGSRAVS